MENQMDCKLLLVGLYRVYKVVSIKKGREPIIDPNI